MKINVSSADSGRLIINSEYAETLSSSGIHDAESLWDIEGEPVKKLLKERGTERVWLKDSSGGKVEAYLKRYGRTPIKKRIKDAFSLKFKSFDAFDEWDSLLNFHRVGIPTMTPLAVARSREGCCCLTLGITDYVRASDLLPSLPTDSPRRRGIIMKSASIAASMHSHGMAHQDFYLVHLFVREYESDKVYLIDLQRVIHGRLPSRWIVKDLGQFIYSAMEILTKPEIDAFFEEYGRLCGFQQSLLSGLRRRADAKADSIMRRSEKRA